MRRPALLAALLASLVLLAPSRGIAGPHLRWDECFGETGATLVNGFACDSNLGDESLVVSIWPPDAIPRYIGFEAVIDVAFDAATTPDWWAMGSTGCRSGNMSFSHEANPAWSACTDGFENDPQAVVVGGFSPAQFNPNRLRIQIAGGGVLETAIGPGSGELFLARGRIRNAKTTGTGSCAGCLTAACLGLSSVRLFEPAGVGDFKYEGWQSLDQQFYATWHSFAGPAVCPGTVPVNASSWGQIKAQYR